MARSTDLQSLRFKYDAGREAAKDAGLTWAEHWVPGVDAEFDQADLTQDQVDAMLRMYVRYTAHILNSGTYTFWQRLKIGAGFIFNCTKHLGTRVPKRG